MIYLNKNSTNQVILELTLNSSLLDSYYLFQFVDDFNPNSIIYFTSPDQSSYKCRYNRFTIIETGTTGTTNVSSYVEDGYLETDYVTKFTNLTASTINLNSRSYTYNIFEAPTPTVELSATTGVIISTGKVIVNGIETSTNIPDIYR